MTSCDNIICSFCADSQLVDSTLILCDECKLRFHAQCVGLSNAGIETVGTASSPWICSSCISKTNSGRSLDTSLDSISCPLCPNDGKFFKGVRGLRIHWSRVHSTIPFQCPNANPDIPSAPPINFQSRLTDCKKNIIVLRRIPKGARPIAADKLAQLIELCLTTNAEDNWQNLMLYSYIALKVPDKSNKAKSLVSKIKDNVRDFQIISGKQNKFSKTSLVRRVEAKVSDGDIRGAIRLLSSDDGIAEITSANLTTLQGKHPPPSRLLDFPAPLVPGTTFLTVSEDIVRHGIMSFPNGSASGIDGLRPQHLKDLTSLSAGESGRRLLQAITKLCNFILKGEIPSAICPFFFGATLIALKKSDGSLRPIAIGNTFRRLVAKLSCMSALEEVGEYLRPHQLGVGTSNGCETIIHSVRTFLERNANTDNVLLKIDFKNAFNCVERDSMLHAVKLQVPHLFSFLWQAYRNSSFLFFGSETLLSQSGVQQGDPMGPMLFSLTLHPIIQELSSSFSLFYLDDGTLGGPPDVVLRDFTLLMNLCKTIGLEVNPAKCELYFCSRREDTTVAAFQNLAPNIKIIKNCELTILGSPILLDGVEAITNKKFTSMAKLFNKLQALNPHMAYFLLKNCLAMPKLTYFVRTTPLWSFPTLLQKYDAMLRTCLESILNIRFENSSWLQACLPVKYGGLGVRRLTDICLPAFLASAYGVFDFIKSQYPLHCDEIEICHLPSALTSWNTLSNFSKPPTPASRQKLWDEILVKGTIESLFDLSSSPPDKARLLALQEQESGSWLEALPSATIGTLLESNSFKIAVALRLGCKICIQHTCICGGVADSLGHHALSCARSKGRFSRHSSINDLIRRALTSTGTPSILEPTGISRSDGKRPDGITMVPWSRGKSLMWDATCVDTLAPSHLALSATLACSAAEAAVLRKKSKYAELTNNYNFVCFAVETMGPWCIEAQHLVSAIGKHLTSNTGDPRATTYLKQRIGLAIQRGNAVSVMGTFPASSALDELYLL